MYLSKLIICPTNLTNRFLSYNINGCMRNYELPPLSPDEESSLLGDLNQEIRNAVLRTSYDFKNDADSIYFMRNTLMIIPSEMARLFKLPERYFTYPERAKIPLMSDDPQARSRFQQILGVFCFLDRVISNPFSRDDFSRTHEGIFNQQSPLDLLFDNEPLQAYALIKEPAKFWGFRDSQSRKSSPF